MGTRRIQLTRTIIQVESKPKPKPKRDIKRRVYYAMDIIDSDIATTEERENAWDFLKKVYEKTRGHKSGTCLCLAKLIFPYIEKFGRGDPEGVDIREPGRE